MSELLGTITRLQVHRAAVKANERYDPAPLLAVDRASIDEGGLIGWDGQSWVMDNHHRAYPGNAGGWRRALSVGFTSHYSAMAARFGATVVPGIAAENIIVETPERIEPAAVEPGLEIHTRSGVKLALSEPLVAAPCREFTSCLLGLSARAERETISDELAFLDGGMRGFVFGCRHVGEPVTIHIGDDVYVAG